MLLKMDRTGSLNQIRISVGAFFTLLPTRGSARTMNACASARIVVANKQNNPTAKETSCLRIILLLPTKQRPAKAVRKQIVEIEMQLRYHADRLPGSLINWNRRFHAELYVLARPDHAGIDRARGFTALSAIQRRVERKFYERDEPVEGSTQADVLYLFLQVH